MPHDRPPQFFLISISEIPLLRISVSNTKALPDCGRASVKAKKCCSKSSKSENGRWDRTRWGQSEDISRWHSQTTHPQILQSPWSWPSQCPSPVLHWRQRDLGSPPGEWETRLCSPSYICWMRRLVFYATPAWHVLNASGRSRSRVLVQSTNTGLRSNPGSRGLVKG